MSVNKKTSCSGCSAEFEIEPLEDYPIAFCPACGLELDEDLDEDEVDDEDHD
jgi:rRNA maturation endonuclease Nob1